MLSIYVRLSSGIKWTSTRSLDHRDCARRPREKAEHQLIAIYHSIFLVMDFSEHDLKTLLDDMREPFLPSETKTLMLQVLSGLGFLHSQWIMHRDLKTSNLLINNRGELKIADFGMARYYGDPPPKLTQLVVTLWYRSPELLLGAEKYGTEIDMWSIGCIFGELLTKEPLLQGKNEVEQVSKVCTFLTAQVWTDRANTHSDLRSHRPSYSPILAWISIPPQCQISPSSADVVRFIREPSLAAPLEISLPDERRSPASLIPSGAEP